MQTVKPQPRCGGVTCHLSLLPRVVRCMASSIGYCSTGNSDSLDPHWWVRGIYGCLTVVSVTHTTPPGGRLCMVVMIHHSWLSGTFLSEGHDIISSPICEEYDKRRAHPNKLGTLGVWWELVRCGTALTWVWLELNPREKVCGYLGTSIST